MLNSKNKAMKVNRDFFRKICGKVSNVTVSRTVGFKPEDRFDFEETTYLFGFKINHVSIKDVKVEDTTIADSLRNLASKKETPKRTIVKGFRKNN